MALGLGLAITLEEQMRPSEVLFADVKYLISPGDAEVGPGLINLAETFGTPGRC
jgi:hypothetical protein